MKNFFLCPVSETNFDCYCFIRFPNTCKKNKQAIFMIKVYKLKRDI